LGDLFWVGTGVALCVVGGGAAGYAIDAAAHSSPWATFGGLGFGIVLAVLLTVSQVRKYL
jgi:F0F1-type ATP synthase assembly protein I